MGDSPYQIVEAVNEFIQFASSKLLRPRATLCALVSRLFYAKKTEQNTFKLSNAHKQLIEVDIGSSKSAFKIAGSIPFVLTLSICLRW